MLNSSALHNTIIRHAEALSIVLSKVFHFSASHRHSQSKKTLKNKGWCLGTSNLFKRRLCNAKLPQVPSSMTRSDVKRTNTFYSFTDHLSNRAAFTLAEVLITIGIIGVVASITIPTLIQNSQKVSVVNKVQKFYSNMSQAIKLSELENGESWTWDYGSGTSDDTLIWFETYIAPYMSYTKTTKPDALHVVVYLNDGTKFKLFKGSYLDITFFTETNKTEKIGKNSFWYHINPNAKTKAFTPYFVGIVGTGRDKWRTGAHACTEDGDKIFCAGLIMEDGWQIKDDYPW